MFMMFLLCFFSEIVCSYHIFCLLDVAGAEFLLFARHGHLMEVPEQLQRAVETSPPLSAVSLAECSVSSLCGRRPSNDKANRCSASGRLLSFVFLSSLAAHCRPSWKKSIEPPIRRIMPQAVET